MSLLNEMIFLLAQSDDAATATAVLFYIFAVMAGGAALMVVLSKNIVRMAVALLFTLAGVAGLYFLLNAEFLAAVQLVVYAGGTLILIVNGAAGAVRMGFSHGLYCLGCCWILMALLFAVGAMNLLWVAALAIVVLAEKLFPAGIWIARLGGLVLIAWGVGLVIAK